MLRRVFCCAGAGGLAIDNSSLPLIFVVNKKKKKHSSMLWHCCMHTAGMRHCFILCGTHFAAKCSREVVLHALDNRGFRDASAFRGAICCACAAVLCFSYCSLAASAEHCGELVPAIAC